MTSSFTNVGLPMSTEVVSSTSHMQCMHCFLSVPSRRPSSTSNFGKSRITEKSRSSFASHLIIKNSAVTRSFSVPATETTRRELSGQFSTTFVACPFRAIGTNFICHPAPVRAMKGTRASGLAVDREVADAPLAIAIRDLALSVKGDRGDVPVLEGCSLNVPEGKFWMLLGPNGCGKSTLLKAMAGLLKPNRGRMYVVGRRSFVFQNPDHQVVMPTAEADVAFGMGRFDLPLDEVRRRVHESLQAVGMAEYAQRAVQTLSGGQKQRIAIAGALAESSRLLLLDELTTYLDSGDQIGVLEAVRKVVGGPEAVTALWVTHRLEELEYADGAAYMENGRVVLSGGVAEIKEHILKQQEEYLKGQ